MRQKINDSLVSYKLLSEKLKLICMIGNNKKIKEIMKKEKLGVRKIAYAKLFLNDFNFASNKLIEDKNNKFVFSITHKNIIKRLENNEKYSYVKIPLFPLIFMEKLKIYYLSEIIEDLSLIEFRMFYFVIIIKK